MMYGGWQTAELEGRVERATERRVRAEARRELVRVVDACATRASTAVFVEACARLGLTAEQGQHLGDLAAEAVRAEGGRQ